MKQFKSISLLLFVFLLFFSADINAQHTQVVTPFNVEASAVEVKRLFGNRINATVEDIKQFYLQHWGNNNDISHYNPKCKRPNAHMRYVNYETIRFDWSGIIFFNSTFQDRYSISHFNLRTEESGTMTTNQNHLVIPVPSDLFIFSFQTRCGTSASALDIVIIEKPIYFKFTQPSLSNQSCSCPNSNLIWESPAGFVDPNLVNYAWANTSSTEEYYCEVQLTNGLSASFKADIEFGAEGPGKISLDQSCMTNVRINPDTTFIYMHEPNEPEKELGVFGFSISNGGNDPQFSFNIVTDALYGLDNIYLYKCNNPLRNGSEENQQTITLKNDIGLKSFSNPFRTHTKIEYNLPKQESTSITLYNAHGMPIRLLENQVLMEAGIHQLDIDLAGFPDGMYFCILKTQDQTVPLKLIKAN